MACPKCGCKVHYQYDSGWDDEQCDERLERCAACGEVFDIGDAEDDDDDIPETQPGAPGFDGADAWNAFNGPEGCNRKASTRRWRGPALAEESLWCMHRGLLRDAERGVNGRERPCNRSD